MTAAVIDIPTRTRSREQDAAESSWNLVQRAQQGDQEAGGLLYERYADQVLRFIYFRVADRPLAEDLASETWLRALKRIDSFTWQGRDFAAWLITIARNLVADHFRSGRYRLEVTSGAIHDPGYPNNLVDPTPEGRPESIVVDHAVNVTLLTAVRQLNPEQQECIIYRYLKGFSVAETAKEMGKGEGAVKALQHRAVKALARHLPDGFLAGAR